MVRQGDAIDNPVTREHITFLETSRDTRGGSLRIAWSPRPGGFLPGGAHSHPNQEERIEIYFGTLGVSVGRRKYRLHTGDAVLVPRGAAHAWWNEGNDPVRAEVEFRPALDTESLFETLFGLARDGKVSEKGVPSTLQTIALLHKYEDELGMPSAPKWLQHAVVSLLMPLARRRGYRGRYPSVQRSAVPYSTEA